MTKVGELLQCSMLQKNDVDFFFALSSLTISNTEDFFNGIQAIKQKIAAMSHFDMMNLLFTQVFFIYSIIQSFIYLFKK